MDSASGTQRQPMPEEDGSQEVPFNAELQEETSKRKISPNESAKSRKRRQAEDVISSLPTQAEAQNSSFDDEFAKDMTDTPQINVKGAIDHIFAVLPKERHTNTKGEFLAAARAFTRGAIKRSGFENWSLRGMSTPLMPHQLLGAGFMRRMEKNNCENISIGGILGDDMGLGKTLQILAVILNSRAPSNAPCGTTLYVVPNVNLAAQVTHEMQRHFEQGNGLQYTRWMSSDNLDDENYIIHWLKGFSVVVTTYGSVISSYKKAGPLHKVNFFRVVFDEGHDIRNHRKKTFQSCHALEAKFKWILTGTPVVNTLDDLFAYFRLLKMEEGGDFRKFRKFLREDEKKNFVQLKNIAGKVMLRRMKSTLILGHPIIPLTNTTFNTVITTLGKHEQHLYDQFYKEFKAKLKENFKKLNKANRTKNAAVEGKNDAEKSKEKIFKLLQTLRQAVGNPLSIWNDLPKYLGTLRASFLLAKELTDPYVCPVPDENLQTKFAEFLLKPIPRRSRDGNFHINVQDWFISGGWPLYSSKLQAARDQLGNWIHSEPDKKILIFTHFLDMVYIFSKICDIEGWNYATYTGKMDSAERQKSLRRLNNDDNLILIMTAQSGSVGLDLSAACRVLIFDLWWNLALEEQARSRVERLGQKNDVEIIRIAARNTIDDKIMQLQMTKADQVNQIMQGTHFSRGITLKDIWDLLSNDEAADEDGVTDADSQEEPIEWNEEELYYEMEQLRAFNEGFSNENFSNEEHFEDEDCEDIGDSSNDNGIEDEDENSCF